jgi:hypothetical protein
VVFLESQSLKNPRATTSLPLLEDEGEEKPFPSSPLSFVLSRAAERPTTSSTTMRRCLPLRRALRRCFFPDDIITILADDDEEDAAKLSPPRGEKEEEVNGTSATADDMLI